RLGANRTGLQSSPSLGKLMMENVEESEAQSADGRALAEVRMQYIRESEGLGSIPPPPTAKGKAKSGLKMASGLRPQAFIDKLAERLAFERGGTRLYDAVLAKFEALPDELDSVTLQDVRLLRDQEANHALLIKECIEELGGDPTAQTPSANLVGMETAGVLQAASDPRTTLVQTLHAALAAELVDHAGWEMLVAFAENMGQDRMAERFREALREENEHLAKVGS